MVLLMVVEMAEWKVYLQVLLMEVLLVDEMAV
jgi:hypothetical protein